MSEFELIDRIRRRAFARDDVILGIGDDAAVLQVPAGRQLVVATDTLNAGVHFPIDTAPADIGWKALAVNLSDLAAMGAQPAWCTLSLSLPAADAAWLDGFLDGFLALASQHRVALVGGDTTRGPLSISVTVHGLVEPGRALRRDAARVGDDVWVSGTLGDAAGALWLLLPVPLAAEAEGRRTDELSAQTRSHQPLSSAQERGLKALRARLDLPVPRVALGRALAGIAHACIDISDGLLADLGHVCTASAVAAVLELDALPTSMAMRDTFAPPQRRVLQTSGGDDYELCFTAPVSGRDAIERIAASAAAPLTRIGRVVDGSGVRVLDGAGAPWLPTRRGHVHFEG